SRNARPGGLLLALRAGPSFYGQVAEKALRQLSASQPDTRTFGAPICSPARRTRRWSLCAIPASSNGSTTAAIVPHVMRHTAITRLAASGADIKTIQEFSGHLSVAMVHRYAHAQAEVIDNALDRLDGGTLAELPRAQSERKS